MILVFKMIRKVRKCSKYSLTLLLVSVILLCGLRLQQYKNHPQFRHDGDMMNQHEDLKQSLSHGHKENQPPLSNERMRGYHRRNSIRERSTFILTEHLDKIRRINTSVKDKNECSGRKVLVYRCDHLKSCGGLGDRQRGIISSFILSLITERVFVIDFNKPCELELFLKPNLYDWTICKDFIKTTDTNSSHTIDVTLGGSDFTDMHNLTARTRHLKVLILHITSNIIYELRKTKAIKEQYGWLLKMTVPKVYNLILNVLFQPQNSVLDFVNNFMQQSVKERSLTCCHIRIGKNPSIPQDNAFNDHEKPNETIVFDYLKRYSDPKKFALYLASDSLSVRKAFWKEFENGIKVDVPIVHIDRLGKYKALKKEACEGLKYVLIEQYMLSLCDTLILTADSGFGKNAAFLRGLNDNLFLIKLYNSQIIKTDLAKI